ncbi:MAG TPA: TIGR02206 family membrane protein [Acidimicrobiales bacterium]|nr:TIGR02206 family membrane protein [Acidimicrobiales bacterium]
MRRVETRWLTSCFDGAVLLATVSPLAYWSTVALAAAGCVALCRAAQRAPGPWRIVTARVLAIALVADAVSYSVGLAVQGTWSPKTSLPLALCDVGVLVAATACWWRVPLLVELTYFWGLAGTLQAVVTPDLNVGFPHLVFFQYLVGHLGIVVAALFLVAGMGIVPRRWSVLRVFTITLGYTALVGIVDAVTGANYMFLRSPPGEWTLLKVLGPWPWYVLSAAGVALVLLTLLDAPFWARRRRASETTPRRPLHHV